LLRAGLVRRDIEPTDGKNRESWFATVTGSHSKLDIRSREPAPECQRDDIPRSAHDVRRDPEPDTDGVLDAATGDLAAEEGEWKF
jgi:hypothetical protein